MDFAIGLITIDRVQLLEKSLSSWRTMFPDVPIYVVDQNGHRKNERLYSILGVTAIWAPYDCGIGAARNRLFEKAAEKYLLLADDDDRLPSDTSPLVISDIISVMESDDSLLVVGAEEPENQSWLPLLRLDEERRVVYQFSQSSQEPRVKTSVCSIFESDAIHNLAIFNLAAVRNLEAWWDEDLKVFEHLPYYLSLMKRREAGEKFWIGRTPNLTRVQMRNEVQQPASYRALRRRVHFRVIASRKAGIDWIVRNSGKHGGYFLSWFSRDAYWVELLVRLQRLFDDAGLRWWLNGKTLAGVVEQGNFAPDSEGISVGVRHSGSNIWSFRKLLETEGFALTSVRGRPGRGLRLAFRAPVPEFGEWLYGSIVIDLTFFSEKSGGLEFMVEKGGQRFLNLVPELNIADREVEAWGEGFPMPVPAESLLRAYQEGSRHPENDSDSRIEERFFRSKRLPRRSIPDWVFRQRFWGRRAIMASILKRISTFRR